MGFFLLRRKQSKIREDFKNLDQMNYVNCKKHLLDIYSLLAAKVLISFNKKLQEIQDHISLETYRKQIGYPLVSIVKSYDTQDFPKSVINKLRVCLSKDIVCDDEVFLQNFKLLIKTALLVESFTSLDEENYNYDTLMERFIYNLGFKEDFLYFSLKFDMFYKDVLDVVSPCLLSRCVGKELTRNKSVYGFESSFAVRSDSIVSCSSTPVNRSPESFSNNNLTRNRAYSSLTAISMEDLTNISQAELETNNRLCNVEEVAEEWIELQSQKSEFDNIYIKNTNLSLNSGMAEPIVEQGLFQELESPEFSPRYFDIEHSDFSWRPGINLPENYDMRYIDEDVECVNEILYANEYHGGYSPVGGCQERSIFDAIAYRNACLQARGDR